MNTFEDDATKWEMIEHHRATIKNLKVELKKKDNNDEKNCFLMII